MGFVTLLARVAGPIIMRVIPITGAVERFLEGMALAVLTAIAATYVAQHGLREAAAVALAAAIMIATRSAVLAMLLAMAGAAAWSALL